MLHEEHRAQFSANLAICSRLKYSVTDYSRTNGSYSLNIGKYAELHLKLAQLNPLMYLGYFRTYNTRVVIPTDLN